MLSWYDIDKFVMYYSKKMLNNRLDWTKRITKIFCYRIAGVKKVDVIGLEENKMPEKKRYIFYKHFIKKIS